MDDESEAIRRCQRGDISGLAPDMPISEVASYDIAFLGMRIGGGGGGGCGGGILELVLPNGEQIFPGVVALPELLDQSAPDGNMTAGQQAQTVGPSGTVELEALFYLPIPDVSGILLYMDHVAAARERQSLIYLSKSADRGSSSCHPAPRSTISTRSTSARLAAHQPDTATGRYESTCGSMRLSSIPVSVRLT